MQAEMFLNIKLDNGAELHMRYEVDEVFDLPRMFGLADYDAEEFVGKNGYLEV